MTARKDFLQSVFPFHILLDSNLKIASIGKSLVKLGVSLDMGTALTDHFRINRPAVEPTFEAIIEHSSTVFFLTAKKQTLTLKGQMLEFGHSGKTGLVFLASPVLRNLEEADKHGLKLNDFALHDSTLDYLVLMQVQESVHGDTKRLADKLLEETKARQEAQEILEHTNHSLEQMVAERTEQLSLAKTKLEGFVGRLNASNQDLRVLNQVDKVLHRCQTVHDAFPTIIEAIQQLFPQSCGRISCYEDDIKCFKINAEWGEENHRLGDTFTHDECPAIARKEVFSGYGACTDSGCSELAKMGDEYYFCRPLRFSDSTMGLIHFHYSIDPSCDNQDEEWQQSRHALASTLAEHMAMGLSNIRLRQKLKEEAIRDPLTRLFNRRYMENILEQEMARATRDQISTFGIILLDVDHFKDFNDTYGHQVGDKALIEVGELLTSQIRKEDIACRYGGEEFLLILINSSLENTIQRAEAIRKATEQLIIQHNGSNLRISASVGVTNFHRGDLNVDTIIRRADDALYEAKKQGRNRVVIAQ